MKKPFTLPLLSLFLLFFSLTVTAHHEPATNKDGSIVTNVLTASFDPFGQALRWRPVSPFLPTLGFSHLTRLAIVAPC